MLLEPASGSQSNSGSAREGNRCQILLRWQHLLVQHAVLLMLPALMEELTIEMQQPCRGASSCL